ncbi:MAG: proprotein convertase P-domain-containing protein [Phycisphaerae bacterium]|nr:proprotein convertase P-domain-containing protein [Phycisphaerae bacterium]
MQRIGVMLVIMAGAWGSANCLGTVHIYSGSFNLPIPEPNKSDPYISKGRMTDAIINVPDHLTIHDLDIGISLTHTNVFDLQIFLQSPAGTKICLNMYNPYKEFFVGVNYMNTIFDDEATLSIKDASPPFTGRFRPVESYELSEFDGEDAFGPWHLQVYDMWDYDIGTLNNVELMISTPEPATFFLLALGAMLLKKRKK